MKNELKKDRGPIYRKIVNMICSKIRDGEWPAGHKLPTVREMAQEAGISCGTVKHAYDELELLGMIEMTQGRGTFVLGDEQKDTQSRKEQAITAIEELFDQLEKLEFSNKEIRIFLDLKLRERDELYQNVRVGVVDCNPEALSIIGSQLSALPNVDIYKFLLDEVADAPYKLGTDLDLIITTSNHLSDVENITVARNKLMNMVLSPSQNTVADLAKIDSEKRVGILCASQKFADIIWNGCDRFCSLGNPPETCLLGSEDDTEKFVKDQEVLIMPPDYLKYCGKTERRAIEHFVSQGNKIIPYDYQIDQGSLFYLSDRIKQIFKTNKNNCTI